MGRIAAATGVPHTPAFPAHVARAGADCEEARLYAKVYDVLERLNPDVIVMFSNDHFNTFFFDNFPLFAIGVAPATSGPNDQTPMPAYDVPVDEALAEHFRR
ncbi:MAG: extradiol ring-cleavage dioxygenase, partial [Alphaproteobacteria bacterium]|nr:extradiol ring-cleavage dioxygenase [Alphaproteobacteria bacterium]